MRVRMMVIGLGLVLVGAACTQTTEVTTPPVTAAAATSAPAKVNDTKPPDAEGKPTETKRNKNAKTYREAVDLAIADIQSYWTDTLPEVYGQDYKPIPEDKLYAATEDEAGEACTPEGGPNTYDDVKGNAFYCRLGKFIAWDDQELLPTLYSKYGEYAVAMVFAHEWGHAIQDQLTLLGGKHPTILTENQADCFAGAWTKHSLENTNEKSFRANAGDLTSALAGMLEFADSPGSKPMERGAHGTGFDRVSGFQVGFDKGPTKCAEFTDPGGSPVFIDMQFQEGEDTSGNLPYKDISEDDSDDGNFHPGIVTLATQDLNAYWRKLGIDAGFEFKEVDAIQTFSPETNMPKCGSKQYSEDDALRTIFFCVEDNYVAWDDDMMLEDVSKGIGDTGVAVLLAKQWAVSAQVQDGQPLDKIKSKDGTLQQSCFTGAWLRAVKDGDEHANILSLSPGDLDEAIKAFLAFSETPDSKDDSANASAFEQVEAFRDGFLADNGAGQCASYSVADQADE